jgi:type IV secretion system protein VirB3
MSKTGTLYTDQLFLGLTRPPMVFGVTYMYVVLNLLLSLMYFVLSSDFKVVIVSVAIHGIAYLICLREPLLIEIFIMKQSRFGRCPNKVHYNRKNSYDPF